MVTHEDLSTYPTDIKVYEKEGVLGKGSFGIVYTNLFY